MTAGAGEPWTVGRVVTWAAEDFRARGIENPRLEAELLLSYVLGVDRVRIVVDRERPLAPEELSHYRQAIVRRRAGEPVAYIRGFREFYGRPFRVDRRALIPRPDTEILVQVALERSAGISLSARVLDLCTGSGCVAITIARERPTNQVAAVDVSTDALALARENALRLGAVHNVRWAAGDLYAPLDPARDRYDVITANPPYIPEGEIGELSRDIREFEPHIALSGGGDGLDTVRRIVGGAAPFLADRGVVAVEIGAGQAPAVLQLFREAGFQAVRADRDYGGHERVVSGVRG
jgi:release factor glutamine methyltransferase